MDRAGPTLNLLVRQDLLDLLDKPVNQVVMQNSLDQPVLEALLAPAERVLLGLLVPEGRLAQRGWKVQQVRRVSLVALDPRELAAGRLDHRVLLDRQDKDKQDQLDHQVPMLNLLGLQDHRGRLDHLELGLLGQLVIPALKE